MMLCASIIYPYYVPGFRGLCEIARGRRFTRVLTAQATNRGDCGADSAATCTTVGNRTTCSLPMRRAWCKDCPAGTVGTSDRQACVPCVQLALLNVGSCSARGYHGVTKAEGACASCGDLGECVSCTGGGSAVRVRAGWAMRVVTLAPHAAAGAPRHAAAVFKCPVAEACLGGAPGEPPCAAGYTGTLCAECAGTAWRRPVCQHRRHPPDTLRRTARTRARRAVRVR